MNVKQLSINMRAEARRLGLCDEWYNNWGDASIQDLLDKFKKGFDFYIQHRHEWLEPDFIKNQCGVEILRTNNILANDKWSFANKQYCYILGKSQSNLRYNSANVGAAWILGDSEVEVTAKGHSHVVIEVYDNAIVRLLRRDVTAKVIIVIHSSKAQVVTLGETDAIIKYAKDFK